MKKQLTIAVTGLNNIDSPGPGIPVIRALRDSEDYDVRIIGLSYETLEPGIYMHEMVDHVYQIPFPKSGTEVIYGRMAHINSMENIDFLFPNFDAELFNFIKLADRMEQELGIKTCLPTIDQFESRHKVNLEEFGEKYGLKVPKSKMIFSPAEIQDLTQDFTFPMVVKGQFYDAHIAYNKGQVEAHFNKLAAKWGLPIVIQEFVYGTEVNIVALGDGEGNTVGMVPMRKQYITDKGKAWAGVSIDDEGLLNECDKMIRESKWKGGLELEYIKTSDDEYYLLEINPRFPAWVYLAVGCGQNLPDAAVKIGMGEKVPSFDTYEVGKMFIRYSWDMIVDMKQFEEISTTGELGANSKKQAS